MDEYCLCVHARFRMIDNTGNSNYYEYFGRAAIENNRTKILLYTTKDILNLHVYSYYIRKNEFVKPRWWSSNAMWINDDCVRFFNLPLAVPGDGELVDNKQRVVRNVVYVHLFTPNLIMYDTENEYFVVNHGPSKHFEHSRLLSELPTSSFKVTKQFAEDYVNHRYCVSRFVPPYR